jgi:hypothetical protein
VNSASGDAVSGDTSSGDGSCGDASSGYPKGYPGVPKVPHENDDIFKNGTEFRV